MKIMIFLQGTAIMHKAGVNVSREERVKQVNEEEESVHEYESYTPVGNVLNKLDNWSHQGAEIVYLSSHETEKDVEKDKKVLGKHNFPRGDIYFRQSGESYGDVVERVKPDILIEDDCESIGGESEMTYPNLKTELKERIKSIVVREFSGIDLLPEDLGSLSGRV